MKELPVSFTARYEKLLSPEVLSRLCYIPPQGKEISLRIHADRMTKDQFETLASTYGWTCRPVSNVDGAFHVEANSGKSITSTPEYFAGLYYVQETASMLPPLILAPAANSSVLDMTAAPGSKTTQLSQLMSKTGAIIANDADPRRMKALSFNIEKQGCLNVALCCGDACRFGDSTPEMFDYVLLDAPCSAEGSITKDPGYFTYWHENKIPKLATLQKELLTAAVKTCKTGGTIVYSTCTIAPEENESIIDWLLTKYGESIEIEVIPGFDNIPRSAITSWQGRTFSADVKKAIHLIPTIDQHESFFIAKIRKTSPLPSVSHELSNSLTRQHVNHIQKIPQIIERFGLAPDLFATTVTTEINEKFWISGQDLHSFLSDFPLKIDRSGLPFGRETQKGFRMAFPFALAYGQHAQQNFAELDAEQTKQFIRGNTVSCSNESEISAGQVLVTHEGMGLGRALFTGENPLKNQTPPEFVLRNG